VPLSDGIPDLLERCSRSVRPRLGREIVFDRHPYGDDGRRAVAPSVSVARAQELFGTLPFQFEMKEIADPIVEHPTTSMRIWGVPRKYRLGTMCFGKGATLDHAFASAACETVERITTWPRDGEVYLDASTRELRDRHALHVDPGVLPLPAAGAPGFSHYDEEVQLSWVPAWCVMTGAPILVPRTLTHLLEVADTQQLFIDNRPNGSASGNTLTEAFLHAIYELIERDAFCIFAYHALPAREIEPTDLSPKSAAVYAQFVEAGVEIRLRDYTSDLGVPVFHACAYDPRGGTSRGPVHAFGGGCHLDARIAAERALFELVQDHAIAARDLANGVTIPADSSEELRNDRRRYRAGVEDWFRHLGRVRGRGSVREFAPAPSNPADELAELLACLKKAGICHVAVADLTTYDDRLPVVRAVCPELLFIPWTASAERPSSRLLDAPGRIGFVFGRDYDSTLRIPRASFII